MQIVHELNQLYYGGVERVIRNLIKFDDQNEHLVVAYQDGPFKKEFENIGAKVLISPSEGSTEFDTDIIHIHSGGGISNMANTLGTAFPVVETIHSPIRSPMRSEVIRQRVGVTDAVSRINHNCITIHNGLDLDELEPTRSKEDVMEELLIPQGIPVIGRLGRIGKDKCLEEFILTCYYLQKEGYEFTTMIVGGETASLDGYTGKLRLMTASLPLKNVVWVGHRDDIANYMQVMDIFLYPSPTEGFGLVFAEAMYSGCAVVSYANDVTREVCGGGAILTEKSIPGLMQGVKTAFKVQVRDILAPIAREIVIEQFDAKRMAQDYQDLYRSIGSKKEEVNVG